MKVNKKKKKERQNLLHLFLQFTESRIYNKNRDIKKKKIGRRNEIFSSIPETHSPLEIKEPESASYVQWKISWGGNVDKTVEITYLHLFLLLLFFNHWCRVLVTKIKAQT